MIFNGIIIVNFGGNIYYFHIFICSNCTWKWKLEPLQLKKCKCGSSRSVAKDVGLFEPFHSISPSTSPVLFKMQEMEDRRVTILGEGSAPVQYTMATGYFQINIFHVYPIKNHFCFAQNKYWTLGQKIDCLDWLW